MAQIELESVLYEGVELYTTGQYIEKFHTGMYISALQYAIKYRLLHYCKLGEKYFIIGSSPITQAYQPKVHTGSRREPNVYRTEKFNNFKGLGGYVESEELFKIPVYTKKEFCAEYPHIKSSTLGYNASVKDSLDYVKINRVWLIALTEKTQNFIKLNLVV